MKKNNYNTSSKSELEKLIKSYDRFVPYQFLNLLGKRNITDVRLGDHIEKKLTILFSDIRDFTYISESLTPKENFNFINSYLDQMDTIISDHNGIIDKFIGDGIMAIFPTSADDALTCSILMLKQLDQFNGIRKKVGLNPVRIGIGLNTGLCILGTVGGLNRMESTVISDAVNLASRLENLTKNYGVPLLISENTINNLHDVSKYSIRFIDRVIIKGKVQPQSIYEIFDNDPVKVRKLKIKTKTLFEEALAHYHYKKIDVAKELLEKCIKINPDDKPAKVYLERCETFFKNGFHEGARELNQQLEWCSDFEVGNVEIDKQHFELISHSVKLLHSIDRELSKSEIESLIAFLDKYVIEHFKTEEKFLSKIHYPFLKEQRRQHLNFIKSFKLLKEEIRVRKINKTYLKFRIQILLIDWVVSHTLKEDKHYGRYFMNLNQ